MGTGLKSKIGYSSIWEWEHWRKASPRSCGYSLEDTWKQGNVTTDEGVAYALDAALSGGTQKDAWYIPLFSGEYVPTEADTYQSPGYGEVVGYEGARPQWQEAGVSSKSLTNSANVATFTMTQDVTVGGGSLVSANTKGDAVSGEVMYCSSRFPASRDMKNEDILKVTITVSGDDA